MEEFDIHVTKEELLAIYDSLKHRESELLCSVSEEDQDELQVVYKLERMFNNFIE